MDEISPIDESNFLPALAARVNQAFKAVDAKRIEVGKLLLETRREFDATRQRCLDDGHRNLMGWKAWCKKHIRRSFADIKKVMAIASADDPQAALEAERKPNRERKQRERAAARAQMSEPPSAEDDEEEGITKFWVRLESGYEVYGYARSELAATRAVAEQFGIDPDDPTNGEDDGENREWDLTYARDFLGAWDDWWVKHESETGPDDDPPLSEAEVRFAEAWLGWDDYVIADIDEMIEAGILTPHDHPPAPVEATAAIDGAAEGITPAGGADVRASPAERGGAEGVDNKKDDVNVSETGTCQVFQLPEFPTPDGVSEAIEYLKSKFTTKEQWHFLYLYIEVNFRASLVIDRKQPALEQERDEWRQRAEAAEEQMRLAIRDLNHARAQLPD